MKNRVFGLDLFRTIAVVIVMLTHSQYDLNDLIPFHFPIKFPHGSDLFLILSGYLIGRSIMKVYKSEPNTTDFEFTKKYLYKRWIRTLPNYFLFLFINIVLIYFGLIAGFLNKYLITYFVFFQNFIKPYDFLYWESWTLAVSEWFYFIFPIVTFVFFKLFSRFSSKSIFLFIIGLFIVLPIIYRINIDESLDWDLFVRKIVLARLDAIGYGLLAAFIHLYYQEFWFKFKNLFFCTGLLIMFLVLNFNINDVVYMNVCYLSILGISICFLLPKFESIKKASPKLNWVYFISKISYSIYWVHMPLNQILKGFLTFESVTGMLFYLLLYSTLTIMISYFIYSFFERKIMEKLGEGLKQNPKRF